MAVVSRDQIKSWFRRGLKPLEVHFASWIDSFWHKNDAIPMSSIDGLNDALNQRTISIDDALSDSSTNPVQNRIVKQALDAQRIEVDSSLSGTSENPVQNKVLTEALGDKAAAEHTHPMSEVDGLPEALNDKASANHNHNGVYQPVGNYAAANHTHSEYLTQHQDISHKQDVIQDLATIRANATMAAVRSYTLDFGPSSELIQDVNMVGAITINRIVALNVARLYVTYGTVSHQLIDLTQPININVPDGAIITWEIERSIDDGLAAVGVRYSINQSNAQ